MTALEIKRLCQHVTPRVRAFLRDHLYEGWPEDFLCGSTTPVHDAPTEEEWLAWANERIPYEDGHVPVQ